MVDDLTDPDERELLQESLEYADHASWRCGHPDRWPWEPDCPCGLTAWARRTRELLGL